MTIQPTDIENQLCQYLAATRFEDLPEDVVEYCKLMVMDSLGVTIPGSRAAGCGSTAGLAEKWRIDPGCSTAGARVMIHGHRTFPPLAAFSNSAMMHALDFDDTLDVSALHTFVSVLPAALAASDTREKISGRDLILSLVLGVDVVCRLSVAISRPLSWIRTATCGSFGAAAAAGKILNLDAGQMHDALGIVYSQTSGNAQGLVEGRLVKRLQPGFAAQSGVLSAFLALDGITGSQAFLTGRYGFYSLYEHGEYDPEPITRSLGDRYSILDLSIKPYPACRMTHSSIDGALELRPGILGGAAGTDRLEQIEKIDITASSMVAEMVGKPFVPGTNPQVDAQFSIPYTVAAALIRGKVFLDDFETDTISDSRVRNLAEKIHVTADPGLPAKDLFHASMKVTMDDSQTFDTRVDMPLGNPEKPMDTKQCRQKFRDCVAFSGLDFKEERQNRLLDRLENLENLDDIQEIMELMSL